MGFGSIGSFSFRGYDVRAVEYGSVSWLRGFLFIGFCWMGESKKCGRFSGFGLGLAAGGHGI